jgi:hypothetical protein
VQPEHLEVRDALVIVIVEQQQRVAEREEVAKDRPRAGARGHHLHTKGFAFHALGKLEADGGKSHEQRIDGGEEREWLCSSVSEHMRSSHLGGWTEACRKRS